MLQASITPKSRAGMIPKEQWDKNKEHIRDFYLTQNGTLHDLICYMSENHDFVASENQYYRKLRDWGMKKYSNKSEWEHVKKLMGERKSDGKETDIIIRGQLVSVKKLKKELGRHAYDRYGPLASPKKPRSLPSSEIIALTPPSSADLLVRGYTIPWFQFQDLVHSLISRPATQSAGPTYSVMLSNWQLRPNDSMGLINFFAHKFPAASDHDELFDRVMSFVQAKIPNRSSVDTITQCRASTSNFRARVFEWVTYSLTNHLMSSDYAYKVLSSFYRRDFLSRVLKKIHSEGVSTTQILLSELFPCAVWKEDISFAKSLLELGASPQGRQSNSLLGKAAARHNSEIVNFLLQLGADPNTNLVSRLETPLRQALGRPGGYDVVKLLVDAGAVVYQPQNLLPSTPLMLASANRDIRTAAFLIEKGAEINIDFPDFPSPLQRAIAGNDFEMVVLLLKNGADPNIRPSFDKRPGSLDDTRPLSRVRLLPLAAAAWYGSDISVAQYLLDCGADIDGLIPSDIGNSDHHTALQASVQRCDSAMTEFFLRNGASPDTRDVRTLTALQQACQLLCKNPRQREIIDLLLTSGADINADPPTCDDGETALQIATRSGNYDLITDLISHGGNIDVPSCLQVATSLDNISLVEFLLGIGADVNSRSLQDHIGRTRTALQTALSSGNTRLVELLLSAGAVLNGRPPPSGMTDLQAVLLSKNLELVQMVMRSGADINENTLAWEQTPLELAADSGSVELVSVLIGPNVTISQHSFTAALTLAVQKGCISVAKFLLGTGVDIDIDIKAMKPSLLHLAITSRCKEMFDLFYIQSADQDMSVELTGSLVAAIDQKWLYAVDRLIEAGVDVNYPYVPAWKAGVYGSNGQLLDYRTSPLRKAVESRQVILVEKLAHAGGDIQARGLEYLEIAVKLQSADIVRLLLEHGVNPNGVFPGTSLTPLHLSLMDEGGVRCLDLDIIRALIEYKACVNAYSFDAGYPLQIVWKWLQSTGLYLDFWEQDECHHFIRPYIQAKYLLLEAGADPVLFPSTLQSAAFEGDIEKVRLLITNGEEVNRPAVEYMGATALQYAAMAGHFDIVALLLKNGANIHAPGAKINGRTALQGAAENGRLDIVHLLLENDDEVDLMEKRCCDAAEYAAREGHTMIAEILWAWSCMKAVSTVSHESCAT